MWVQIGRKSVLPERNKIREAIIQRVFGCRAFAHVPDNERSKLDGKSKECIFLGYSHDQFGYRLWDSEK